MSSSIEKPPRTVHKTLDIYLSPVKDQLNFHIHFIATSNGDTKREFLSVDARLYYPLGWLSPSIILIKWMFQKIMANKVTLRAQETRCTAVFGARTETLIFNCSTKKLTVTNVDLGWIFVGPDNTLLVPEIRRGRIGSPVTQLTKNRCLASTNSYKLCVCHCRMRQWRSCNFFVEYFNLRVPVRAPNDAVQRMSWALRVRIKRGKNETCRLSRTYVLSNKS